MRLKLSPKGLSFIGLGGVFFALIIISIIFFVTSGSYAKINSNSDLADSPSETTVFMNQVSDKNLETPVDMNLDQSVQSIDSQEHANTELKMRLQIPEIGVDSVVIAVGLTADGAMDVPKGPAEVAWYNRGPRPGENGNAVIAGHYDWKNNTPAVFNDLDKLSVGDKIIVVDEKDLITTFVVREIKIYNKDAIASEVFVSNDGMAHLNLITCMGDWNKTEKTYSERLVVFADKE